MRPTSRATGAKRAGKRAATKASRVRPVRSERTGPKRARSKPTANESLDRDRMVVEYLPLVRHVVSRIAAGLPAHVDNDELFQVGSMGLVNASRSFDVTRGVTFKTYAYALIRGAILDELRRLDLVPRSTREKIRAMERAVTGLTFELDRKPAPVEVAERMGTSEQGVLDLLRIARTVALLSLDDTSDRRESLVVRDIIACPHTMDPSDRAARSEIIELMALHIGELPDTERRVVTMYYREGLLLREIGAILGVTESRVSQIHSRAIQRLRSTLLDRS
jgi:RNA polymerase sigma factor for flagellar operon FliA